MTLEQFMKKVAAALEEHYGEQYTVKTMTVRKNNGVCLQGLSVLAKEGANRVAPTLYLEEFYERYMGGVTMAETLREIIRIYEAHTPQGSVSMDFFLDYEKVSDRIMYKLINYEMNRELLREIPHFAYLDLAVVFYYYLENEAFGAASILINNAHMDKWAVSRKRLIADAKRNTPRALGYRLNDMEDMMRELLRKDLRERLSGKKRGGRTGMEREAFPVDEIADHVMECFLEGREEESPMYVLTNCSSQNGAACMLYPDVLKEFAQRIGCDLYILPSSIHEVILIRNQGTEDTDALREMVKDVNRTQLDPEEVLSDQVYYYSRQSGKVGICEKTNMK